MTLKELIEKVREIDPKAADYIEAQDLLPSVGPSNDLELSQLFTWHHTPQGHDYWRGIHKQIWGRKL